ncbi:hypothetical protein [Crocosphaera sp. XPORK-15E]|uniref:hypothetical protein n=1 Tax=Crocosphaera sp. XPORK-15E TaxID=3110247 RepID=UPI002B216055|nr:hypothetical protein [Crocosphaera sp. XPORK-15E]MEA5536644.1 hypothetical protein [Crocosphaera sp. XPORK-15E]
MLNNLSHQRLSTSQQAKISALSEAQSSLLNYGEEGLLLAIQILNNEKGQMRLSAYDLLWEKLDPERKKRLIQLLNTQ